jgi:hypothetical protein
MKIVAVVCGGLILWSMKGNDSTLVSAWITLYYICSVLGVALAIPIVPRRVREFLLWSITAGLVVSLYNGVGEFIKVVAMISYTTLCGWFPVWIGCKIVISARLRDPLYLYNSILGGE